MPKATPQCTKCLKTAPESGLETLQRCSKCKTTHYCSRECQPNDWKAHKKICCKKQSNHNNSTYSAPRLNDLDLHVRNPFTRLDEGTYLHDRPERDVYKLLIDAFRMRLEDEKKYENRNTPRSIYSGALSSIVPFRRFLDLAATRPRLLPAWWTAEKRAECEAFGESGAWNDLRRRVSMEQMREHYGDSGAHVQLRLLAEFVYGLGLTGKDGTATRKQMRQMEEDGGPADSPPVGVRVVEMDVSSLFNTGRW
ncbi:hypothetical protein BDW02DRAFT_568166 [Decorospora gaudefroyi]|uniref:MYND-type domain-containing protein n=1 Tax=Decorospora gaudefroyi TaxID=184978 RepID=A0A6A5KBI6_9PLEO|nr:hypothetical protein BDW02DRAFT_568166 [Decorospora gaudefroyi]